ncbi:TraR/DksA family transcriptional regulator [Flavihumibacter sp.]|nr:TraR/DksA C4-type zinc finger protein [Flavihumibacter sediminis]
MATKKKAAPAKASVNAKASAGAAKKVAPAKKAAAAPQKKAATKAPAKSAPAAKATKAAPAAKGAASKAPAKAAPAKAAPAKTVPSKAAPSKAAPSKAAVKTAAAKPAPAPAKGNGSNSKAVPAKATDNKKAPVKAAEPKAEPAPKAAPAPKEKKEKPVKPPVIKKANARQIRQFLKTGPNKPTVKDDSKQTTPIPIKKPAPPPEKRPTRLVMPEIKTKTVKPYNPDFTKSVLDQEAQIPTGPSMRYSDNELVEFKDLINKKLDAAKKELAYLQGLITRKDEMGGDESESRYMTMEDGSVSMEREQLSQMASRQITFIDHLEKALMRIENKTYGICRVTGKLIDKARLRAVPHATLSIEAKNTMNK